MIKSEIPAVSSKVDAKERAWWDSWNLSYRSQNDGGEIPAELFARTAAVIHSLAGAAESSILEVGCGAGSLSRRLVCKTYHGIDISPAAIEIAREKSREISANAVSYEAFDFHDWPAPSERYNVVICVDAVAYFHDQAFALKKMAQSLRPSGMLVLTTINPFVYHRIQRTSKSPLKEGDISRWLSRSELHALIQSGGFEIERSWTIMPRGNRGVLRLINNRRIDAVVGQQGAAVLKRWKEKAGLGQYRIVVARKS